MKKLDPDDLPGLLVVWSFAILCAALCVGGSWFVIKAAFDL